MVNTAGQCEIGHQRRENVIGAFPRRADNDEVRRARSHGRDETLKLTESLPFPSAPVHIDAVRSRRESEARETIPDRFLDARGEVAPLPDLERELIAFALKHYGGRMSKVARALKIGRSTLYRKLREYGLEDGVESDAA